jgi:predicted Fe-Mo cluster-binding NifX family protein
MSYIVIETFGGAEYAIIVTDEDGNNKVFENKPDAEAEAADCQDAVIFEL